MRCSTCLASFVAGKSERGVDCVNDCPVPPRRHTALVMHDDRTETHHGGSGRRGQVSWLPVADVSWSAADVSWSTCTAIAWLPSRGSEGRFGRCFDGSLAPPPLTAVVGTRAASSVLRSPRPPQMVAGATGGERASALANSTLPSSMRRLVRTSHPSSFSQPRLPLVRARTAARLHRPLVQLCRSAVPPHPPMDTSRRKLRRGDVSRETSSAVPEHAGLIRHEPQGVRQPFALTSPERPRRRC